MNSMLIVLFILIFVIGLNIGVKYLKLKNVIKQQDIDNIILAFGITSQISMQMGLENIPKIKQISEIIIKSLEYVKVAYQGQNLYENTKVYVYKSCEDNGIKLNQQQTCIIDQLIMIALNAGII